MWQSYINGVLIALGLIMAIGAQNAFVLSQALRREHHLWVASVCVFFDVLLVALGVYGLAQLLTSSPLLLAVARWGGVVFLSSYAVLALLHLAGRASAATAIIAHGVSHHLSRHFAQSACVFGHCVTDWSIGCAASLALGLCGGCSEQFGVVVFQLSCGRG